MELLAMRAGAAAGPRRSGHVKPSRDLPAIRAFLTTEEGQMTTKANLTVRRLLTVYDGQKMLGSIEEGRTRSSTVDGACWCVPQKDVRLTANWTLGRCPPGLQSDA
jgi:hypothetical protein